MDLLQPISLPRPTFPIILVIWILLRQYVKETILLKCLYDSKYAQLSGINGEAFVNHRIAG